MNIGLTDINEIDEIWGTTRLHRAIEKQDLNEIKSLLDAGANPNIPDELDHLPLNYGGSYPLHYAVEIGNIQIIQLLLQYGANPTLRNSDDELPIDIANNRKIYKLNHENHAYIANLLHT